MAWYDWLTGTAPKIEQVSRLTPEQQKIEQQLQSAVSGKGAGGAFGTSADYFRDLLSDNPQDLQAFAAPEMRRFREQTIPGLSEQFAGMGAGGLSSSGFQNASVGAGTDLSERLGAIRAQLRQSGASGLQGLGTQALQPTSDWMQTSGGTEGVFGNLLSSLGTGLGSAIAGPVGGAIGGGISNLFGLKKGSTSPYGKPLTSGGMPSSMFGGPR